MKSKIRHVRGVKTPIQISHVLSRVEKGKENLEIAVF